MAREAADKKPTRSYSVNFFVVAVLCFVGGGYLRRLVDGERGTSYARLPIRNAETENPESGSQPCYNVVESACYEPRNENLVLVVRTGGFSPAGADLREALQDIKGEALEQLGG